jgi:tRNA nucleotidyltransferase (CCA-adding enzyme)
VVAVGDAAARVREHPVRWLRYYRKAREWDFELDRAVRRLDLEPSLLLALPPEAITGELRAALVHCASPGRFLLDLHEVGLLAHLAPELAPQFDGRPAGPQQWHPEVSQGLHLILALEWAAAHGRHLDERDRLAVMIAVLGHDLGKGRTPPQQWPGHPGHEQTGLEPLDHLLQRCTGLADQRGRTLARAVCLLHQLARQLRQLRPGTLARLYDEHFRPRDFPVDLFALAVGADSGGRLDRAAEGLTARDQVAADVHWLRACCDRVDAAALRARHDDVEAFRRALHEARARAIAAELRVPPDVDG